MSAPSDAITLKEESAVMGRTVDWSFTCNECGYHGKAEELLVDPSGEDDTMWCPQCGLAAWIWD